MEPRAGKNRIESLRILDDFRKCALSDFPVYLKAGMSAGILPLPGVGSLGYPGFPIAE